MAESTGMTEIVEADTAGIARAVSELQAGGIVALPTETVYGLGADAEQGSAVAAIYAAKGRPSFNPLIVHVSDRAMATRYARFSPLADRLADCFWPGPLTLVLPKAEHCPAASLVTSGLPTIAVRVPAHPAMRAVIAALGHGIAAPSANASGRLSPTSAAHVNQSLSGRVPLIVDGGPSTAGLESSIVAVDGDAATLLRHGALPLDLLQAAIGHDITLAGDGTAISAPGMMLRHYAPAKPLRMDAAQSLPHEWHIGFGPVAGDDNLSASGDMPEAAARLFDALHRAEASGRSGIAVAPVPIIGLGEAINDRLRRAARG